MTLALLFWILMLFSLFFGGWFTWSVAPAERVGRLGGWLLPFLLFALLGWKVFGAPVTGG